MTYTEWIIGSVFFGCFATPFVIIGAGFLFYPRKAIDNAVSMAKNFPATILVNIPIHTANGQFSITG